MRRPGSVFAFLGAAATVPVVAGWAAGPPAATVTPPRPLASRPASRHSVLGGLGPAVVVSSPDEATPTAEPAPRWFRACLAALAAGLAAVVVAVGHPGVAKAEAAVNVYFGQGCFWHMQHDMVVKEIRALERDKQELTALAGYAGGTKVGSDGRVCYHNLMMAPDYGQLGHTEVVNVSMPEDKVVEFAKDYFDAADSYMFGRRDPQDRGSEYRSAIGIPGGVDGPLFKQLESANKGRLQLVRGEGNDSDTVGTKKVWIYDTAKFPFYQGEVYHQFHDDMTERYNQDYHKLKETLLGGTLKKGSCPEMGF